MVFSGARGFGLSLARGRGRAVVVLPAAAVLAGVGLFGPAVPGASADTITVAVSNQSPGVNGAFTVTARALNSAMQTDTSFSGSASWSDKSGHLTPSTPSAFFAGVSKTAGAAVSVPYHSDTITVMSGGLSGTSRAFNVIGPLDHFSFSKLSTVAQNQPFRLVVQALDSAGNVITGYGGSPSWSDISKALSPSAPASFVKGVSVNTNPCASVGSALTGDRITVDDTSAGVSSTSPAFNVTAAQVFNGRGTRSFALPCAASITATVIGAHGGTVSKSCGGGEPGGEGALVTASLTVSAGKLTAGVGGPGGNGSCGFPAQAGSGGTGSGANGGDGGAATDVGGSGGGGASLLSTGTGSPTASSLLLVAGGGGGTTSSFGGDADSAGSPQPPICPQTEVACGGGAGIAPGGTGGANDTSGDSNSSGSNGGFLFGGNGGIGGSGDGGGGGGGGYYGGGGGGAANMFAGGGGGGESFIVSSATNTGGGPTVTSSPAGISITYAPPR
jgi:hypothetical protein